MRAGELRNRVILLKPVYGEPNSHNEAPVTWEAAGSVWAKVEELSGAELFKAQEIQSDISTRVVVRYESAPVGLGATWRISYRTGKGVDGASRILELAAPPIDPEGRRRELNLLCKEAVNPTVAQQELAAAAGSGN